MSPSSLSGSMGVFEVLFLTHPFPCDMKLQNFWSFLKSRQIATRSPMCFLGLSCDFWLTFEIDGWKTCPPSGYIVASLRSIGEVSTQKNARYKPTSESSGLWSGNPAPQFPVSTSSHPFDRFDRGLVQVGVTCLPPILSQHHNTWHAPQHSISDSDLFLRSNIAN